MPVKGIRVIAHGHDGDPDPSPWFKMLGTTSDQCRPATNGTDEDSDAYYIVAFTLLTGNTPRFCDVGGHRDQVVKSIIVGGWSYIHADDVCLREVLCECSSPDCASTAEVEQ